ncbi:hypothetical protein Gogos_018093, partial [Gossypium gossypioides]|nr:hypothetical protein [Gossypium gossypioides]
FCCGLWLIWTDRNKLLYEGKPNTSWDISKQIKSYILEFEGIKDRKFNLEANPRPRQSTQRANTAIFFGATFDSQNSRSASGLVVKNEGAESLQLNRSFMTMLHLCSRLKHMQDFKQQI